jgi:uncharacterized protein YcfL
MKKVSLLILALFVMGSCSKTDTTTVATMKQLDPNLVISSSVGVKLQTSFVTSEVSMNIKSQVAQTVTVKILDLTNRIVSKSTSDVKVGDNVLTLYTSAFPSSAYRIAVYDANGNLLAITDFNKL